MALFNSKNKYAKNDINFFAAFTESARKTAQMLAYVVIFALIIFGIFIVWLVRDLWRNNSVSKEIEQLQIQLAGEEYQNLEVEANSLQSAIEQRQRYYYTLSQMRMSIEETDTVSTDLIDLIGESIPNNSYIYSYSLSGNTLAMEGYSFTYYGALNMVNILEDSDVFTRPLQINTNRVELTVDPIEGEGADATLANVIDTYYQFNITGQLTTDIYLNVNKYVNSDSGIVPIGGVEVFKYSVGDTYQLDGISQIEYNGSVYTLSSIAIDGVSASDADLSVAVANDQLSGIAQFDTSVDLYYTVASGTTEGGAE